MSWELLVLGASVTAKKELWFFRDQTDDDAVRKGRGCLLW